MVTILGKTTGDDGKLWYKISYVLKSNGKTVEAYCHDYEVQLDKPLAKAVLTANEVSVRDGVGTSGTNILIQLYVGHQVEILGSETASNGTLWYRIRYITPDNKTIIGWSVAKYYDITGYNSDPDYVKQLVALGFPESYANRLALLHTLYPEWVFEPVHTGLTWNEVIAGETKRPINMVPTSYDDAKKSVADTEYDWLTNRWTIRDGDSWVAVHPDYLAYVMDPRNFMTEEYIFQFESLSYNASQTIEGVKAIIGSSFMSKDVADSDGTTLNYANAFMSIAKEVG